MSTFFSSDPVLYPHHGLTGAYRDLSPTSLLADLSGESFLKGGSLLIARWDTYGDIIMRRSPSCHLKSVSFPHQTWPWINPLCPDTFFFAAVLPKSENIFLIKGGHTRGFFQFCFVLFIFFQFWQSFCFLCFFFAPAIFRFFKGNFSQFEFWPVSPQSQTFCMDL